MSVRNVVQLRVVKADGTPIAKYEVPPDRWVLFGRTEGRSWVQQLDASASGNLLTQEFPDLLDRLFTHVVLPDEAIQGRDREGRPKVHDGHSVLEFLTSSRSLVLVHGPAGWWLINPSEATTLDVRGWGKQRTQLRPRGDRLLLRQDPVAVWIPSNFGGPHRIEIQLMGPRTAVSYGAAQQTRLVEHRFTDANKRALTFFFEDFLRWDPPVREPRVSAYATDRVRALRASGAPAPRASKLRDIFKSVAERDDRREMWLLPTTAEVSAHLWTLELAIDTGELTYPEVQATLAGFDRAELAWRHVLAEQVSRYEQSIAAGLAMHAWWQAAGLRERGALLNRVGKLVDFALDKRDLVQSTPETFLTSLTGMSVRELQAGLTSDGRVTLPADDVLDRRDIELVGDLVLSA